MKQLSLDRKPHRWWYVCGAGLILWMLTMLVPVTADEPATAEPESQAPPLGEDTGQTAADPNFETAGEPLWRFGAGGVLRSVKTRSIRSGSFSQDYPLPNLSGDKVRRYDSGGDLQAITDRHYNNGYVLQDEWTDLDGSTWNWGYERSHQVRDGTVRFYWTDRVVVDHRRNTSLSEGVLTESGDTEEGVYFQAQRILHQTPNWDCRLHFDLSRLLPSAGTTMSNFRDEQTWRKWEEYRMDVFSLEDTGISSDSPPYQGNRDDTGPSISNLPLRRQGAGSRVIDEQSVLTVNEIRHDLDMQLLTISLAAAVNLTYRNLNLGFITGPTINLVETDITYHERLLQTWNDGHPHVLQEWLYDRTDAETAFGYFTQMELGLRLTQWLDLAVFGRYDWIENISRDAGQARYLINPEGGSLGGTVNLRF
ncbi:MAG: hypothetical protein ABR497_11295 [Kiritimatiellia bacterium]